MAIIQQKERGHSQGEMSGDDSHSPSALIPYGYGYEAYQKKRVPTDEEFQELSYLSEEDEAAIYFYPEKEAANCLTAHTVEHVYMHRVLTQEQKHALWLRQAKHPLWILTGKHHEILKRDAQYWHYQEICMRLASMCGYQPIAYPGDTKEIRPVAYLYHHIQERHESQQDCDTRLAQNLARFGCTQWMNKIQVCREKHPMLDGWNLVQRRSISEQYPEAKICLCIDAMPGRIDGWVYFLVLAWIPDDLFDQFGFPQALIGKTRNLYHPQTRPAQ